jgi:quercetin dioxygenase-like cupin family protein/heme-degrading monooxygenase HmoA
MKEKKMEIIDLKSREIFSHQGRGVAALVEEPYLKIRQVGLEAGKDVPVHTADAPVTIQVMRGEGLFSVGEQNIRMGPGKLLRVPMGESMGIQNDSQAPLVFLVIKIPLAAEPSRGSAEAGKAGMFVNLIDFAPLKPGKEEAFSEWFRQSSEVFAKHPGFISRTLLGPIEGGSRYAALVEHESKETFMDMHLSDDREHLFREVESLFLGASTPHYYERLFSYRKK